MNASQQVIGDSCQPMKALKLKTFRIYSIIIPVLVFILIIEAVFVFMSIPETLGNALSIKGKLPTLPALPMLIK